MKDLTSAYDAIVLGAGASGLMCALTAAGRGRRVLVLEKANKLGKKILMSGGGRCNFTNQFVDADNFLSGNPHFCKSALSRYTQWDFIARVEQHGIEYEQRKHGQLFCKHSAQDILHMLLDECALAGVEIRSHCAIEAVAALPLKGHSDKHQHEDQRNRYRVDYHQGHDPHRTACQSLVVATGALSIPTLGGSGMGYDIARQFELAVTDCRAALVPFMFSDAVKLMCERLAGIALEVTLTCNGRQFTENLLFTHRGISGPAVLQISSYWLPGDAIEINLLPGVDVLQLLLAAKHAQGKSQLKTVLTKVLPKALVGELQALWWPEMEHTMLAQFSDHRLDEIATKLQAWTLKPSATEGYRTAEVTLGGVATDGLSSKTMEASKQPGLYFVGEVVDVTGHLGGYNFQWAWSSGYSAGLYA